MSSLTTTVAVAALLGAGLISGVFFAFSSFIMQALARVAPAAGIAAMQSINRVVINPSFLGLFMGTAAICVLLCVLVLMHGPLPSAPLLLAGAALYFGGTFLVTIFGNVPLNDRLASIDAADAEALAFWDHYLLRWTRLNTIRTIAAAAACLLLALALIQASPS